MWILTNQITWQIKRVNDHDWAVISGMQGQFNIGKPINDYSYANLIQDKNHTLFSKDADKVWDKIH